jgi:hypothetical protein
VSAIRSEAQIRTASQAVIHSSCLQHGRVIEFTCRRSDLWWVSAIARPTRRINSYRLRLLPRRGYLGHIVGIERAIACEHRPQDARVLVGQRHHGFLPAHTFHQLHQPQADALAALITADLGPWICSVRS